MIHSVSELQINTFRLLHGKIAGFLLAFFQKLHIETLFPEAVSYSLLPSEHRCTLCSRHQDLGCPESMGCNQRGQGRKCVGVLSSSVATSLQSGHWASLSKTETKGKKGGIVLLHIMHSGLQNPKTTSFWTSSYRCIHQPLMFRCFYNGIFSPALYCLYLQSRVLSKYSRIWVLRRDPNTQPWAVDSGVCVLSICGPPTFLRAHSKPLSNPVWARFGVGNSCI